MTWTGYLLCFVSFLCEPLEVTREEHVIWFFLRDPCQVSDSFYSFVSLLSFPSSVFPSMLTSFVLFFQLYSPFPRFPSVLRGVVLV